MEENRRSKFQNEDGDINEFIIPNDKESDKEPDDIYNLTPEQASDGMGFDPDEEIEVREYSPDNYEEIPDDDDEPFSSFFASSSNREAIPEESVVSRSEIAYKREAMELEKKKQEKSNKMVIEGHEIIKEFIDDALDKLSETGLDAKKIRTYKNEAVYFKSKFAKAQESEENPLKGIIVMAIMAFAGGIFGGIQANSYYIMKEGKGGGVLNCAFSWILSADEMNIKMSPFYVDIFFGAFFIWLGLLAIIFLFSYLNNKTMKKSRVGHEHGNAKLMDNKSFEKYKNRFMEG